MEWELLAAIAAAPCDPLPREVYADWLLTHGDERGELLALDTVEYRDGLGDPEAIDRLLRLSARYGFPAQPGDPEDERLPFTGGGAYPEQHECTFAGHAYYVRYRHHALSVTIDDGAIDSGMDYPHGWEDLDLGDGGEFGEFEREVVLSVLGRAIRLDRQLPDVEIPFCEAIERYRVLAPPTTSFIPARPPPHPLFGVVDYERWGKLWRNWAVSRHP